MYKLEKLLDKLFGEPPLTREAKAMIRKNDAEVASVTVAPTIFSDLV